MSGLNRIMLIGNVGTDPEMRFTANGNAVTSFRLAVSRVYNTHEGEKKQETDWFTVVTWGKTAESCNQFLTKGKKIFVEGSLISRSWEGQDGQKKFRYEAYRKHSPCIILTAGFLFNSMVNIDHSFADFLIFIFKSGILYGIRND